MNPIDYDRALYYTHRSQWDNLLILMVRTKDDFLSKKIEHVLHAYHFSHDYAVIEHCLYGLFRYLDHASEVSETSHEAYACD
ncbi:YhdB family protein [Heyndrickxia acidiproducens]|uniref:YhdB family protein n=1 Tax=Heyndrickxia acidiproducens TaxID=1121084 RepID=UPI00036923DA|nr:YhdB family protein [Heyndrickxia acidiproducens]